ncbi:hypothetical protein F4775DRAFT_595218 [Biscogniauxia sp. FL1348]|nr:hypothetical protein F4775DRAFT_595218 [Biscogniauxia sp. FL1348]
MDGMTPNPTRRGRTLLHSVLPQRGFEYRHGSRILRHARDAAALLDALAQASSYLGPRQVDRRLAELFRTALEWSPPASSLSASSETDLIFGHHCSFNPAFEHAAQNTFWTAAAAPSGLRPAAVAEAMAYLCAARALYIKFTTYRTPRTDGGEGRLARAIDAFTGTRPAERPLPCFRRMDPRLVDMIIWRVRRGLRANWDECSGYNDEPVGDEALKEEEKHNKKNKRQGQDASREDKPLEQGKENQGPEKEGDGA